MTAVAIPNRLRIRPLAMLAASIGVIALSQVGIAFAPASQLPQLPAASAPAGTVEGEGPSSTTATNIAQIDRAIRTWTANFTANDRDFYSATNLGILYDARARLTGDVADYGRALEALSRALAIEPSYMSARLAHLRELQATHDFTGALGEAKSIDHDAPGQPQALATWGDASLELGDVAGAEAAYARVAAITSGAPITARQARLVFLHGDVAGALALAARSVDEAAAAGDTGPSASWYSYLCGTLSLSGGQPAQALDWFDRALDTWPESYLALSGRGRALATLGRTDEAIVAYQAAIAITPQPDALTALGDLYALRGDDRAAQDQYATVEVIAELAEINAQVYNRQLAQFWLNHDLNSADALKLAETELATRKDIYGWDTYAWALMFNGRPADADAAMASALALGTHDALLYYHAGVIAQAVGDPERAQTQLAAALAIPGGLDPLAEARARAVLDAIR